MDINMHDVRHKLVEYTGVVRVKAENIGKMLFGLFHIKRGRNLACEPFYSSCGGVVQL